MPEKEVAFGDLLFLCLLLGHLRHSSLRNIAREQSRVAGGIIIWPERLGLNWYIMTAAQETVILQGHIIDSLILAKVLDTILMMGGSFDLSDVHHRDDAAGVFTRDNYEFERRHPRFSPRL
jgi:Uncharacterized conserved protein